MVDNSKSHVVIMTCSRVVNRNGSSMFVERGGRWRTRQDLRPCPTKNLPPVRDVTRSSGNSAIRAVVRTQRATSVGAWRMVASAAITATLHRDFSHEATSRTGLPLNRRQCAASRRDDRDGDVEAHTHGRLSWGRGARYARCDSAPSNNSYEPRRQGSDERPGAHDVRMSARELLGLPVGGLVELGRGVQQVAAEVGAEGQGFEPWVLAHNGFQDRCNDPTASQVINTTR